MKRVLQFFTCADEPIGSALIKDPRINAVLLTGATSTAKQFLKMRPASISSLKQAEKIALSSPAFQIAI